jgi:AcrR family transcriptional regulator
MATSVPDRQTQSIVPLRDEQTSLTRHRILEAVVRILATNVADLSVEAVARASGVSRPTVYRYFRTKRDMVEAVGQLYAERIGVDAAFEATNLDELLALVPGIFARYDELEPEIRAAAMRSETREATARRPSDRVALSQSLLERELPDVAAAERERVAQVMTVLMSSAVLQSMRANLELSPVEAGELVQWTVRRLIRHVTDHAGGEERTT